MLNPSSRVKETALTLLQVIDDLAQPRIKSGVVRRFWDWFFVSHGKNAVHSMSDSELKEVMKKCYTALKPIYEEANLASQIIESRKLNSPEMNNALEKMPKFKDIMDLMPE